jgi:hypothetical protein
MAGNANGDLRETLAAQAAPARIGAAAQPLRLDSAAVNEAGTDEAANLI